LGGDAGALEALALGGCGMDFKIAFDDCAVMDFAFGLEVCCVDLPSPCLTIVQGARVTGTVGRCWGITGRAWGVTGRGEGVKGR
jgi:hypothetical protein